MGVHHNPLHRDDPDGVCIWVLEVGARLLGYGVVFGGLGGSTGNTISVLAGICIHIIGEVG